MTVRDLIAQLQKLDQGLEVIVPGVEDSIVSAMQPVDFNVQVMETKLSASNGQYYNRTTGEDNKFDKKAVIIR
jgi:hypothetical protein